MHQIGPHSPLSSNPFADDGGRSRSVACTVNPTRVVVRWVETELFFIRVIKFAYS